jgi:hypothetical protein
MQLFFSPGAYRPRHICDIMSLHEEINKRENDLGPPASQVEWRPGEELYKTTENNA